MDTVNTNGSAESTGSATEVTRFPSAWLLRQQGTDTKELGHRSRLRQTTLRTNQLKNFSLITGMVRVTIKSTLFICCDY